MYAGISVQDGGNWPRPSALWGRGRSDAPLLFERAPLLSAEGLRDPELVRTYPTASGELPGSLSMQAVFFRDLSHRMVVKRELSRPESRQTDVESGDAFVSFLQEGNRRTPYNRLVTRAWDLDTWAFRQEADRGHVANLRRVMGGLRKGEEGLSVSMMAWDTLSIPAGYDVELERRKDPAVHGKLKFERRVQNGMGVFIAYEWVEVTAFERVTLHMRYPELPA